MGWERTVVVAALACRSIIREGWREEGRGSEGERSKNLASEEHCSNVGEYTCVESRGVRGGRLAGEVVGAVEGGT